MLEVRVHRSFLLLFLSFVALSSQLVAGQTLINGQTFTNGLAIIDSPSSQTPGHAGSPINIAIDVSGNGALPAAASLPDSHYSTGFGSLEIYLVSSQTNINMTVSAGPALLSGESGSTVKHLNWPIPACMPAGDYNLTFYENSLFNTQGIFTITSIPIPISNPSPAGQCTENLNPLQAQPQSSNPLPQPPFAPGSPLSASEASATSSVVPASQSTTVGPTSSVVPGSQSTTVAPTSSVVPGSPSITVTSTPSASRMVTVISGSPFVTLTLTLSDGVFSFPTITVTAQPTPTTVVLISTAIITETDKGTVTTYTQTSTTTAVITPSSQPDNLNNSPGFIPVNAASHTMSSASLCLLFSASWILLLYSRLF